MHPVPLIRRSLLGLLLILPLVQLGLAGRARADDAPSAAADGQVQKQGAAAEQAEAEPPWEFSVIPEFEHGSKGVIDAANSIGVPFLIKRHFSRVDLSLTIPFEIAQVDSEKRARRNHSRKSKRPEVSNWYEGLGDILLDGSFDAVQEGTWVPDVTFTGEVLFPTGDTDKSLGVGGFTGTIGLQVSHRIVEKLSAHASFSYSRFATTDETESENYLDYGGGISIDATSHLRFCADYDETTTQVKGEGHARSLNLSTNYSINKTFEVNAGGEVGLSSAATKFGFSGGLIVHF